MAKRLLLDTHALIWALAGPDVLDRRARRAIEDPNNAVLVSPASLYEINLKIALGKLAAPSVDLLERIDATGFSAMPIRLDHAALAGRLPFHHRDPFDRLLIAQAHLEGLTLVSRDVHLAAYGIEVLPC
ncbi:MAG TPA: type II toxin-antitoxin system VapC family toxin [Rhodothermales bacterium]